MPTVQAIPLSDAQRELLRATIAEHGTQAAFAARLGTNQVAVAKVLGGESIGEARLRHWCDLLGLSVEVVPARVKLRRARRTVTR